MKGIREAAILYACLPTIALAQSSAERSSPDKWREVETKYIFGFTEGSGIGLEGEKEFSPDTTMRMGKGGSRYFASETQLKMEVTPNQYVQFESGPFLSGHKVTGIDNLDDRSQFAFGGAFWEIRYLLLERGASSPFAVTLSAEPEWRRTDETSGARVTNLELELKLNADLELIKNRLYLGANLLYEPEGTHDPDGVGAGWKQESKIGFSGAVSYRIVPDLLVGAEAWYLRHYDGMWLNTLTGDAIYIGPTVFFRLNRKMFMSAAWNVQVAGREVDNPDSRLNLSEFSHHRAKLKFAVEF